MRSDLIDPFRDVFSWLQPSESREIVFVGEDCSVLMTVREYEKYIAVLIDDVVEWVCVGRLITSSL